MRENKMHWLTIQVNNKSWHISPPYPPHPPWPKPQPCDTNSGLHVMMVQPSTKSVISLLINTILSSLITTVNSDSEWLFWSIPIGSHWGGYTKQGKVHISSHFLRCAHYNEWCWPYLQGAVLKTEPAIYIVENPPIFVRRQEKNRLLACSLFARPATWWQLWEEVGS